MDRSGEAGGHRPLLVHGLTEHVEDAAQGGLTHGNTDGRTRIEGLHAAHQTIGAAHGYGPHPVVPQELLHLGGEGNVLPCRVFGLDAQGVKNAWQLAGRELHVENGADHLPDDALGAGGSCSSHM